MWFLDSKTVLYRLYVRDFNERQHNYTSNMPRNYLYESLVNAVLRAAWPFLQSTYKSLSVYCLSQFLDSFVSLQHWLDTMCKDKQDGPAFSELMSFNLEFYIKKWEQSECQRSSSIKF